MIPAGCKRPFTWVTWIAGNHTLILGGYSNKKNSSSEISDIYIDDVALTADNSEPVISDAQILVDRLDIDIFKSNILTLSNFGDRIHQTGSSGSYPSYFNAQNWVETQLQSWGYTTYKHTYTDGSLLRFKFICHKGG